MSTHASHSLYIFAWMPWLSYKSSDCFSCYCILISTFNTQPFFLSQYKMFPFCQINFLLTHLFLFSPWLTMFDWQRFLFLDCCLIEIIKKNPNQSGNSSNRETLLVSEKTVYVAGLTLNHIAWFKDFSKLRNTTKELRLKSDLHTSYVEVV